MPVVLGIDRQKQTHQSKHEAPIFENKLAKSKQN